MIYGFTFKNKHSSEFGVYFKTLNRTITPPVRKSSYIIPNRNGDLTNIENTYDTRTISITASVLAKNLNSLRQNLRTVASWLNGKGELIFDDEPDKTYYCRIDDNLDLSQVACNGHFQINFICQPFAYGKTKYIDIHLGNNKQIKYNGTYKTPCVIILTNNSSEVITHIRITVRNRKEG